MSTPRVPPTLVDGNVRLRAHAVEDVRRIVEQSIDPDSQRWTTVPIPYADQDAHRFVTEIMPGGWADGSEWAFALEVDGRYAGTVSLRNRTDGRAEVAFGSHPDARGTGAVERGLRLLLTWGWEQLGLQCVIWWANRGNWASRDVAWRLGFSFDGTVRKWISHRGELVDGWVGTLLRTDAMAPRDGWLACPVIEGDGVRLRPFHESDVPRIVEGSGDPDTQHWLAQLPTPYTTQDALTYLQTNLELRASGTGVVWAVVDRAHDDVVLASVGLFRIKPGREGEVGYWVHPDARGRGVARRAAAAVVGYAFDTVRVERVTAYAMVENTASRRVLESIGMQPTGVARRAGRTGDGASGDLAGYDLLAEEWRDTRR